MGLGDVSSASVPKTVLLAAAARRRRRSARASFIPVQPHTSIGVLGAVSVVTGMLLPGAVGARADRGLAARTPRRSTSSTPPATCWSTSSSTAPSTPPRGRPLRRRPHRPQAVRRHRLPRDRTLATTEGDPMPPLHDIAHLAHVELLTDKPEESLDFFVRYLGMTENGRPATRCSCAPGTTTRTPRSSSPPRRGPGVGRTNFRASSPEALQRRVAAIEATGLGRGWQDGDPGYGPVVRVHRPRRPRDGRLLRDRVVPADAATSSRR